MRCTHHTTLLVLGVSYHTILIPLYFSHHSILILLDVSHHTILILLGVSYHTIIILMFVTITLLSFSWLCPNRTGTVPPLSRLFASRNHGGLGQVVPSLDFTAP